MPHSQINLLPEDKVVKLGKNPILAWYSRVGVYVLVAVYIVTIAGFAYRWVVEQEFSEIQKTISKKAEQISEEEDFIKEYRKIQESYKVMGKIDRIGTHKVDYLHFLRATIPEPASIVELNIAEGVISLVGEANEYGAINQWYRSIEAGRLLVVSSEYIDALNKGKIPDGLKSAINTTGFNVGEEASLTVNEDDSWTITTNGRRFVIRVEDDTLGVYLEPKLFSAIQMNAVERNFTRSDSDGEIRFTFQLTLQKDEN